MTDLNNLTSKVLEEKKASLQEEIDQAEREVADEVAAFEKEASEQFEADKKAAQEKIEREKEIQRNSIKIEERNEILSLKQDYIKRILDEAQTKMNETSDDVVKQFAEQTFPQFEGAGQMTLTLGEHSQNALTSDWVNQQAVSGLELTVSDETIANEAGFVLEQKGIEYNFLFSELLEAHRSQYIAEINQKLF